MTGPRVTPSPFPLATVQVDMDPVWYIAKCFLDSTRAGQRDERTIYELSVPSLLEAFAARGVKATFFVVGVDLEDDRNLPHLERILDAGHELANHTYFHSIEFKRQSDDDLRRDVDRCAEIMERRLGVRPRGFKAPAYAASPALLRHLESEGYLYDSSVHPNAAIPLVKAAQRLWLRYDKGKTEFGSLDCLRAPLAPYRPDAADIYRPGNMKLWEIPVSTMPIVRFPFHFSFVNVAGMPLFRLGAALHRHFGPGMVNYAFHAVDILDVTVMPKLVHRRFGMKKSSRKKLRHMDAVLAELTQNYAVRTTAEIADGASPVPGS